MSDHSDIDYDVPSDLEKLFVSAHVLRLGMNLLLKLAFRSLDSKEISPCCARE